MRNKFGITLSDLNKRTDVPTDPGSRIKLLHSPKYLEDGTLSIEVSGKNDIQIMINSYRDDCDMTIICQKLLAGDLSVVRQSVPMYGDFSKLPKSVPDMLNLMQSAKDAFYSLSLDVRAEFDNDFHKWLSMSGSDQWFSKMSIDKEVKDAKVSEVSAPAD